MRVVNAAFQTLIGTVRTKLIPSDDGAPVFMFQTLIGTVRTRAGEDEAGVDRQFQTLIGTVRTSGCGKSWPASSAFPRFKPS